MPKIPNSSKPSGATGTGSSVDDRLFHTTFSRVFFGITLTAIIALAITEIISYRQLKSNFDRFATKQVIILQQIGQELLVKENMAYPADYQDFIATYQEEMGDTVLFSFGVGFLLSLIAGVMISRQITLPLSQLRRTIQGVTRTGYKIRAQEHGSKEMRDVAGSFNRLIDELEQQEALRQELFADISHELKTPITKIRGQIEGIIDGVYQADSTTLTKVLANISQLEYLIQTLYEVNRLTPQDVRLEVKQCRVKPVIEESISGFDQLTHIPIKVSVPDKLTVKADPHRFKQIIDNLVGNAIKYTKSGDITITADKKRLIVMDTGIGINPQHLPHIFERLYRAEKSRSRHTGGLGLGLYIVKKLVMMHGWKIEAESQEGKGTTFTVKWA